MSLQEVADSPEVPIRTMATIKSPEAMGKPELVTV